MQQISPTSDLAFKKVFASDENKDILAGLIRDFFEVEAEELIIENPYSIEVYRELIKNNEVMVLRHKLKDVAATFKTADFVSEVQVQKTNFFEERSLLYPLERFCQNYNKVGHMMADSDGKPNRYSSLRPVYSLNILGYKHFSDDDALRIFELYDPIRKKSLGRLLRIGYFELMKANIETINQKYWYDFFNTGTVGPDAPGYIQKASGIIDFVNLSAEEMDIVKALERAQADYDAGLVSAFLDGKGEGIAEGMAEVAKKMLTERFEPESIAKLTGLSFEQIEALAAVD